MLILWGVFACKPLFFMVFAVSFLVSHISTGISACPPGEPHEPSV